MRSRLLSETMSIKHKKKVLIDLYTYHEELVVHVHQMSC